MDGEVVSVRPPISHAGNAVLPLIFAVALVLVAPSDGLAWLLAGAIAAEAGVILWLSTRVWLRADQETFTTGLVWRRSVRWSDLECVQVRVAYLPYVKLRTADGRTVRVRRSGGRRYSGRDVDVVLGLIREHAPEAYAAPPHARSAR